MNSFEKLIAGDEKNWPLTILLYFFVAIALISILLCILKPFFLCCKYKCVCGRPNLNRKYGREDKSAYAVVTGGSDGIGLALCHHLAEEGFNICIVSRNKAKVDEKLKEIKEKFPDCETVGVQCDFS